MKVATTKELSSLVKEFGLGNDFSYLQDFTKPRSHYRKGKELTVSCPHDYNYI